MDDFTYRGRDIREFGASAAFGASMSVGLRVARGGYTLPGGGTILLGRESYSPTQRSVTIIPADGVCADERWRRNLLAWLQGGMGEMIVHNDPEVMRIVSFDSDGTSGVRDWPDGALVMTMTLEPLAYDVRMAQVSAATSAGEATLIMPAQTGLAAPIRIGLRVTGGTVTAAEIRAGGRELLLSGMRLRSGQLLTYDSGMLLGDPVDLQIDGGTTFAPLLEGRWARLFAKQGEAVTVSLTGGEAMVSLACRGWWPA